MTQQHITRRRILDSLAAQRRQADEAGRERGEAEYRANLLERMGELAQAALLKESAAQARKFEEAGGC